MEAVVLAGGFGTRLRAAVADVPKPMAPVGGRPFLELLLDYWIGEGVRRAVLAVGYKKEIVRAHFGARYRGCEIAYSEEERPLGTGGALLNALPLLNGDGPFLVLNGDTYFAARLDALASFHREHNAEVTMSLFRSADAARYTGVSLDGSMRVTGLGAGAKGELLVNGGVLLFERHALAGHASAHDGLLGLEDGILAAMLKTRAAVFACVFDAPFVDIGVPEDWRAAEKIITEN